MEQGSATAADEIEMPALLRAARGSYGQAIRAGLREAGFEDLPRNGPYVLGGMANHGLRPQDLIRDLDVSKQGASQLIDTLVVRGYLDRQEDPGDRRRMTIALTGRGQAAAQVIRDAIRAVDTALAARISPTELAGLRRGLTALWEIKEHRS